MAKTDGYNFTDGLLSDGSHKSVAKYVTLTSNIRLQVRNIRLEIRNAD